MARSLVFLARTRGAALAAYLLASAASAGAQTIGVRGPAVRVSDPSVRVATGTPNIGAGYMTLSNAGGARVVIRAFECQNVRSVRLHVSTEQGGVMRMVPLDSIELAPHGSVVLRPGGAHLMLEGPNHPFRIGALLTCTLHAADGGAVTWVAPVRAP